MAALVASIVGKEGGNGGWMGLSSFTKISTCGGIGPMSNNLSSNLSV